ncbi:hypothetical protein [Ornithinimicrobium sp. Y1694]|uniref:hypothetical protein n=1 Tax=Ornithinimicrobium sp. Y1694 TaxID=3418590 RepID=UPI003CF39943
MSRSEHSFGRWHGPAVREAAEQVMVARPGGHHQVGVGPGSMVVTEPGSDVISTGAIAAALVRPPAPPARPSPPCLVRGVGEVASALRQSLGSPAGTQEPSTRCQNQEPGLTILVHQHVLPLEVGTEQAREMRTTLPIVVQERRVVIGPLVRRETGPCLHCLDRHRADRDPAWPDIATWWGHPVQQAEPVVLPRVVKDAAVSVAALVAHAWCSGGEVTAGLSHEVGPGIPQVVTRRWHRHPGCGWHQPQPGSRSG